MFFGISLEYEALSLFAFLCFIGATISFFKWRGENRVSWWHRTSLVYSAAMVFGFLVFVFSVVALLINAKGRMDHLQRYVNDDFYASSSEITHMDQGVSMILSRDSTFEKNRVYFWNKTPEYLPSRFQMLDLDDNGNLYMLDRIQGRLVPILPNKKK